MASDYHYVKRDDVVELLMILSNITGARESNLWYLFEYAIDHVMKELRAAEVRDNVRGEWKPVLTPQGSPEKDELYDDLMQCSNCTAIIISEWPYCPCCGAKMKEV